jgi:hypothetical protein
MWTQLLFPSKGLQGSRKVDFSANLHLQLIAILAKFVRLGGFTFVHRIKRITFGPVLCCARLSTLKSSNQLLLSSRADAISGNLFTHLLDERTLSRQTSAQ